jgi:dTDP-4-dehydrorhamnose reductase
MNMLIIGASGLLGQKLFKYFSDKYQVAGSYYSHQILDSKQCVKMNIADSGSVASIFKKTCPDIVVLCAAFTNVDACEVQKENAFSINVTGPRIVAKQAEKYNAKFVYVSSDYVFDGEKGGYTETDITKPINYYGETKLKGEQLVCSLCSNYLIMRPSVIFGWEKQNFATWIIESLKCKKKINIIINQFVSPTLNTDFAMQLEALLDSGQRGVFHSCGFERISRFDFACLIAEVFSLDKTLINPIDMKDMMWIAKRPKDSSLDVSKVSKFKKPISTKESIKLLQKEIEGVL